MLSILLKLLIQEIEETQKQISVCSILYTFLTQKILFCDMPHWNEGQKFPMRFNALQSFAHSKVTLC